MPIFIRSSFKTLGMIPFNLNPHYLDPDTTPTHMGETRETRMEFLQALVPIGIRIAGNISKKGDKITLKGFNRKIV
jgi:dipeptidase E